MDTNKIFDTEFNYQKIAFSNSRTDTIPASGGGPPPTPTTLTITHGLGYIPSVRVWYEPGNGRRFPISFWQYSDDTSLVSEVNQVTAQNAYLTTTSLVINYLNLTGGNVSVTTYYRIYYDT